MELFKYIIMRHNFTDNSDAIFLDSVNIAARLRRQPKTSNIVAHKF